MASQVPIDEVFHFDCITSSTTGAVSDADSTPTFAVYEENTDTDIGVGGNLTKRTSLTGNYRGSFTCSAANGFEAGKWYSVVASATVGGVSGKAVVAHFRVTTAESVAGVPKVDVSHVGGTSQTARDLGASVLLSPGTGTGQVDLTSGVVKANLAQILGTAITGTAAQLAAAFTKFFNVATPTGTVNSLPDAVPGAAGALGVLDSNGNLPANLRRWLDVAPAALTATGKFLQVQVMRWKTDDASGTPADLSTNRVPADAQAVTGTVTLAASQPNYAPLKASDYSAPPSAATITNTLLGATAADYNDPGTIGEAINTGGEVTVTYAQVAAAIPDPVDSGTITLRRGETLALGLTGLGTIPAGRSKLWFTVKANKNQEDSEAILQIEETGGLLYLNGGTPADSGLISAVGAIIVTNATTGALTLRLSAAASALFAQATGLVYDLQYLNSGTVTTLAEGRARIVADVTRATS